METTDNETNDLSTLIKPDKATLPAREPRNTQKLLANFLHVSTGQVYKMNVVDENWTSQEKEWLTNKKTTINRIFLRCKERKQIKETIKFYEEWICVDEYVLEHAVDEKTKLNKTTDIEKRKVALKEWQDKLAQSLLPYELEPKRNKWMNR